MSISSELQLFFFLGSLVSAVLVTPTQKPFAIHYDLFGHADRFLEHGQFVFPAILFVLYATSLFQKQIVSIFRVQVSLVTSLLLLVLQGHASLLSRGHDVVLPRFVIPGFLAVLAIVFLNAIARFLFSGKKERQEATSSSSSPAKPASESVEKKKRGRSPRAISPRSPRSPRSLIKQLASPEPEPVTTPTKSSPRGRSKTPRGTRELRSLQTALLK